MLRNMTAERQTILALCVLGFGALAVVSQVFKVVLRKAHQVSCLASLKHLGLGISQYAQDNDGALPAVDRPALGATWKTDIMPYVKSEGVFRCPSRSDEAMDNERLPISYAVNTAGVGRTDGKRGLFAPSRKPVNVDHIRNASEIIAVCEVQKTSSPGFDIDDPFFGPRRQVLYAGHDGLINIVFLDGHARSVLPMNTAHSQTVEGGKLTNMWYIDGSKPLSDNGMRILAKTMDAFDGEK